MTIAFQIQQWVTAAADISEVIAGFDVPTLVLYNGQVDVDFLKQYWPDATYQQVEDFISRGTGDIDVFITDTFQVLRGKSRPRTIVLVGEAIMLLGNSG